MKQTILVVDDTIENIDVVVGILNQEYKVKAAANGEAALKIVTASQPDLVLLDIMMPGMDGYEVCIRLKSDPARAQIPIIFITAKSEASDIVKGLKMGAADYIAKPFHPAELHERVRNALELVATQNHLHALIQEKTIGAEQTKQLLDHAKATAHIQSHVAQFTVSVPSSTHHISDLLAYLHGTYQDVCDANNVDTTQLAICLTESITNAIIHGNLEVSSSIKADDWNSFYALISEREAQPLYVDRKVLLSYRVDPHNMTFEIEDEGQGFNVNTLPDPDDPNMRLTSGRGIMLIRSMMDEVEWNERGNQIRMTKRLKTP
jgi:CheY-like chemotaxis protein/anti-sigma regulatory factor (Ser/Thr protein kinase)